MSEMVERVAAAIERANNGTPSIGMKFSDVLKVMARAAIEEMREPTKAMIEATETLCIGFAGGGDGDIEHNVYCDEFVAEPVWRTMIDAALATPNTGNEGR